MMLPKEAKDALRSLEHLEAEVTKMRKEMAEFKLLLAQQNDILKNLAKPTIYTAAVDESGNFVGYIGDEEDEQWVFKKEGD